MHGLAYETSILGIEMAKKWYVVYQGRVPGVHDEWDECQNQVNGFKGNNYKGYKSKAKAESRYMKHLLGEVRNDEKSNRNKKNWKKTILVSIMLLVIAVLLYVISCVRCMYLHVY
jgi:hypothetical protein